MDFVVLVEEESGEHAVGPMTAIEADALTAEIRASNDDIYAYVTPIISTYRYRMGDRPS